MKQRPGHRPLRRQLLQAGVGLGLGALGWPARAATGQPWTFAAIGDMPRSQAEVPEVRRLLRQISATPARFALHLGDLKDGREPCTDALLEQRLRPLAEAPLPVIYTPGDNDWADCSRESAGGHDPVERLALLRRLAWPSAAALGREPLLLERQSQDARFARHVENALLVQDGVLLATFNLAGGNNNFQSGAGRNGEWEERDLANRRWLEAVFERARQASVAGLVLAFHANPDFERSRRIQGRDGFAPFREQLIEALSRWTRPVLLLHGDTHQHRIDRPLRDRDGRRLGHVLRVEVMAAPVFDRWVEIGVDARSREVFSPRLRQADPALPGLD